MNKIEKKLQEGGYSSLNAALRAVKLTKEDKVTKTRLTQLVEDYFGSGDRVEPIASNKLIVGIERVAALSVTTAAKNNISLDELFDAVKKLTKFWGID